MEQMRKKKKQSTSPQEKNSSLWISPEQWAFILKMEILKIYVQNSIYVGPCQAYLEEKGSRICRVQNQNVHNLLIFFCNQINILFWKFQQPSISCYIHSWYCYLASCGYYPLGFSLFSTSDGPFNVHIVQSWYSQAELFSICWKKLIFFGTWRHSCPAVFIKLLAWILLK